MVRVPETVRAKAVAAGAQQWLRDLPSLVAGLELDWSITVGRVYDGATEAFVAEASIDGGTPAVLKLLVPRDDNAALNEIAVLRLTDGTGCVKLLRHDQARGALLLERLGPSLHDLALPMGRRHEILCAVARRVCSSRPTDTRAAQTALVDVSEQVVLALGEGVDDRGGGVGPGIDNDVDDVAALADHVDLGSTAKRLGVWHPGYVL
jgi:hypothetical protein